MWDLQTDGVTSGSTSADKASIKPFALGNELKQESQSQPKPDVKEDHTAKRPAREGPISLLLATDFDNAVLVADSMVTGTLSLVPLTRNVRDHPKRLGAIDKSTFKASKILHYHDTSGIRPDKQIEDRVKEMQEQQKKRMKARGHDLNANLSLPVWKGSSGGGARAERGDREGSPLGGGTGGGGKKRGGGRRTTTSYSSDEDMDGGGGRGAGGYGGGDYESDDFVVSCFLGFSSIYLYIAYGDRSRLMMTRMKMWAEASDLNLKSHKQNRTVSLRWIEPWTVTKRGGAAQRRRTRKTSETRRAREIMILMRMAMRTALSASGNQRQERAMMMRISICWRRRPKGLRKSKRRRRRTGRGGNKKVNTSMDSVIKEF